MICHAYNWSMATLCLYWHFIECIFTWIKGLLAPLRSTAKAPSTAAQWKPRFPIERTQCDHMHSVHPELWLFNIGNDNKQKHGRSQHTLIFEFWVYYIHSTRNWGTRKIRSIQWPSSSGPWCSHWDPKVISVNAFYALTIAKNFAVHNTRCFWRIMSCVNIKKSVQYHMPLKMPNFFQ